MRNPAESEFVSTQPIAIFQRSALHLMRHGLALALVGASFTFCGGEKQPDLDHPPALEVFAWDAPAAKTAANLKAAGWQQTGDAEGRLEFEASISADPETRRIAASAGLPDAPPAVANITLFSQADQLNVVRMERRGNRDAIRAFVSDLADDFEVEGPVWESEPRETNSETGNRTTRREQLFETPQAWIAARMIFTEAAEAQLSEASISEVELQFFGKATNEGLSQGALVESLQAE